MHTKYHKTHWHMLFTFNSMNKSKPKYLFLHCGYLYMALTCFGVQNLIYDYRFYFLMKSVLRVVSPYQTFRSTLLNLKGQETQGIGRGTAGPQRPPRFDFIKSQSVSQCYPVKDTKHSGKLDDALDKGGDDPPPNQQRNWCFLIMPPAHSIQGPQGGQERRLWVRDSFPIMDLKKGYTHCSPAHRGIVRPTFDSFRTGKSRRGPAPKPLLRPLGNLPLTV